MVIGRAVNHLKRGVEEARENRSASRADHDAEGRRKAEGGMRNAEGGRVAWRHPSFCLLPTAYCLLPTAYCLLPTGRRVPVGASILGLPRVRAAPVRARGQRESWWTPSCPDLPTPIR
ncbi:MAG: hypothetical protein DCC67_00665 [Planctomycetota bacterium]|nr:MAG: hypothetical protein DCC67_00665 [Planctomycetota bacterium]